MQGEHVGVVESVEAEHAIVLFGSLNRNDPRLRVPKKPQISYQDHQKTLKRRAQKTTESDSGNIGVDMSHLSCTQKSTESSTIGTL